jgi:hypothetical protein
MRTPTTPALSVLLLALPATLGAQHNLFPQASIVGGVEARQYSFGGNFTVDKIRQIAFPVGVLVPVGERFSFDIGTNYAITTVTPPGGGSTETFSDITDTQLRGSYVFGNDALVASVMVNLPTGPKTTTTGQFGVTSSASSNFLLFPVNVYGTGFSVTPGLAAAATAGDWNLGIAGSLRVSSTYNPFSNQNGVKYEPGIETRLRAGVDRLIGSSRLQAGFTFSTFGNDELRSGSGSSTFDPGNRFIVDVGLMSPAGIGTVGLYVWNYHRTSSGSATKENVFTAGVNGSFPLTSSVSLDPIAEARLWSPETGKGSLFGAGTSLRIAIGQRAWFVPGGRFDFGRIRSGSGSSNSLTSWSLTGLLRYGL